MEEPTTPDAHSTNSAFRESDIEFLRASAREWLEAVLEEDLDKQTSLEDLLADGTVLYRVSQHIKEDHKFPGHVESASTASPSHDRKTSRKYQPYTSVEAFLNVCKEVGLRDVDVFNPSDAVDKKDIRRVCVCLRRLSKKSRTLHILVPDFDNVKATLITPASKMSREAVQKTKETLQQSASKSSSRSSENGQVSSETSSAIADLRKDDTETESPKPSVKPESATPDLRKDETESSESPKPSVKVESTTSGSRKEDAESASLEADVKAASYNKVHHDRNVTAEHTTRIVNTDSKYTVKAAEPGVDTLRLAPHPHHHVSQGDHVDRNGAKKSTSDSSPASKVTSEAPPAPKPTMSKIMLKPPGEAKPQGEAKPPVEEKPKAVEEIQKGLFRAHLQGTAPYISEATKETNDEVEKDDNDGNKFPLLPVLGGALGIAGGIVGLLFWKKRSGRSGGGRVRGFFESGKKKLQKLRGEGDDSDSSSESDSDDEGHRLHSGGLYKVKEGDSLTRIAKKSGKQHWHEIADKNPSIDNPDLIYPGDRLKL